MPPVEVKVDFDVDNGDYKQFIKELREKLADNPDHRLVKKQSVILAEDPTLLPKQEDGEPDKWIYIKLSVEGPRDNITLAVRGDNVYLLGFKNHRNIWYEGNIRRSASKGKNIIEPNHLLKNSTFVGYFFRYGELMGKSGWDKYKLGKISVSQAVRVLSKYNGKGRKGNEIKKYLVKLIVMICECARMHPLNEIVENGWDEVKEAIITGEENGWDEPKEAIITGEEDGWDEPEEDIITDNEDGGNKPEEAILTGEEDGYIHNWKNMSRAMMGWLEYPILLPENIVIKNHADARKVIHLILNSPMLGKEQGPDVYTKDESPPPDDRNDRSQRKNHGGHGRGSGGSGGRTTNGSRGSGGGGDQTGGSGSAGGKSKGKGKGYAGRSLVEVFALHDDAEIPFVGSIIIFDGRSGQIIYSNEEKEDTPIKDMKQGDLVLTGPCRGISANGRVGLKITGTAKNDVLIWDPYAEAGHQYQYDQLLTKKITGSLELRYAVLSSAVEARVQVHVFLFGNSNTAVYGQITTQSQLASGEEGSVVLFNSLVPVKLLPSSAGSAIPLTRSVVTWPVDSPLEINLEKVRFGNDDALFEGMKFSFNDQKEKVHFQTLEGIGYVRVSVDDTREYRDGPETSLPRSLTNQIIKMNPDMSKVLTELLDVHPSNLCFEPNKLMTCLIHLTNKTDDQRVYFSFCAGQGIWEVSGALPADSTSTYLLSLTPEHQRPSKEYELPLILQSWVALEEEEDEEDEDEEEEDDDKNLSVPTAPANAEKVALMATVSSQVEEAMTSEGWQQEIKIIGEQRDGHNILSMEVLTQEIEQCTLEMQHEMTDGVQDVQRGRSMEVVAEEEHNTLPKQREIEIELLDPHPELLSISSTPSTQIQTIDKEQNRGTERSMEVVAEEEHNTLQKQHEIKKELLDPLPELLSISSTPSTEIQTIDEVQNRGIERSMAVVSASHGTLGPLLGKLTDLLVSKHAGLKGVRREVRSLRSELMTLHAGMTKYTMLEDPDVQVKDWISLVRELSYDTEDCIDKFIHQLGNGSRHSGFKQFFRKTARKLKTLGSRHKIAEKIGELKVYVKNLKDLKSKLNDTACITSYHSTVDPRLYARFAEESHLVGIEGPRDDLAKWMVEVGNSSVKHHPRVLSIVGFAGLGKTTLANEVYRKTKGHFDCGAFVSVSQKPDIKKIMKALISQMSSHGFTEDIENWDEKRSIAELRELLQDKRYLLVIDDIWSELTWDIMKHAFPENNCSSRIITTTRIMSVARTCCSDPDDCMYKMKPLSDFHSKELFLKVIFGSKDGPSMLEEVSNEILKKCGGIPLAIISISSLLANRPANKEEWEKLRRSIGCAQDNNRILEGMRSILWLSYKDLPDKLKTCLLYLSNFPEGYVIERERLVRRWIAEGFICEEPGQSQQEVAQNYFYELINKSLIQAVDISYDGKARACQVHDMMLDLIISMSAECNFVTVIGSGQTGLVNRHGSIRRLSVQHMDQNLASVLANEDLSHVRSLTVTSSSCFEHLPSLASFENLRVLDFEGCEGLEKYHMKGLEKFFQLKYLSLKGTWISHLPSEVVMLHSLETLDIRETQVEELPAGIVELTMLQHLIASTDYARRGIKIPNGIGNMRNLRVLLGCGIGSGSARALGELGNLTNLNELDVEYREIGSEYKRHEEMFLSSLRKLGTCKLQSFRIRRRCPGHLEFLESWSPLPYSLQRFEMSGCCSFRCIPEWISPALTSLASLEINLVEVTEKDLRILGEMPALLYLGLRCQTFRKERLTFHGRGFRSLKEFVYDAAVLPSGNLLFEEGALPMLENLDLVYCVSMVNAHGFCLGIQHLPQLKNARLRLYKEGATCSAITSAEVAIRNEADAHPNHPTVTLMEHDKRVDYCSEECPNRTVTELL